MSREGGFPSSNLGDVPGWELREALQLHLADASYWVYFVHLPILFAIQYRLLDVAGGWHMKFEVSVLATSLIS